MLESPSVAPRVSVHLCRHIGTSDARRNLRKSTSRQNFQAFGTKCKGQRRCRATACLKTGGCRQYHPGLTSSKHHFEDCALTMSAIWDDHLGNFLGLYIGCGDGLPGSFPALRWGASGTILQRNWLQLPNWLLGQRAKRHGSVSQGNVT